MASAAKPPHSVEQRALDQYFVVLPALNEGNRIGPVLKELQQVGFRHIVVVNDGSTDHTSEVVAKYGVREVSHLVNLGPGASTMTGIKYALKNPYIRYIATIDSDHQSDPRDLVRLAEAIKQQEVDLLIGSRFLGPNEIPLTRRFYNWGGNLVSYFLSGHWTTDSQSGLKVMTRRFASRLNINHSGFEFCIDIIRQAAAHKFKIAELPVSVVYTADTMQKGQNLGQGLMMLGRLFNPFR